MRRVLLAAATAMLGWAAVTVPLPLVVLGPVPAQSVSSVIEVSEADDDVSGELLFTAVTVEPATTVGTVTAWWDRHRDVDLQGQVIPEGVDRGEYLRQQQEVFAESLQVAAAVGLRAAGREVTIEGSGARIVAVLPGAPAEQELRQDDVVVSAGGEPVRLASELVAVVGRHDAGDTLELTIRRDDRRLERTIIIGTLPELDQAGLGVLVETVDRRIQLPVQVRVEQGTNIGGPSAGLMMALTVYDRTDPADLTGGRAVAGTGTVDTSGNVGPVGGIAQKVRGAELAGAEVFLVPAAEAGAARAAAPDDLRVIGVETLRGAIRALRQG